MTEIMSPRDRRHIDERAQLPPVRRAADFDLHGDTLVASQNTNGRGVYEFLGLLANECIVDVVNGTVPPGYGLTTANDPKATTLAGGHDEPVVVAVPERHGQDDGRALLDPDRGQRRP